MSNKSTRSFDYNQFQQVCCLNAASNAVGKAQGTTEALQLALQVSLAELLPKLNSSWTVTWGPVVYKQNASDAKYGPLNAWYAAVDEAQKLCVVAIAGTAGHSLQGWFEDSQVGKIVDFGDWSSKWTVSQVPHFEKATHKRNDTRNLCGLGTCKLTSNVLANAPPAKAASPNVLLAKYLQDFQAQHPDYQIIFTGHSMGGALSPSVALGLVLSKILSGNNVAILPLAGASPGGQVFAAQFEQNFPRKENYNAVLYNELDIVPQAWSTDKTADRNLDRIALIYHDVAKDVKKTINGLVNGAKIDASLSGLHYVPLPGKAFSGPAVSRIDEKKDLGPAIYEQHEDAYWDHLEIAEFVNLFSKELLAQPDVGELPSTAVTESDHEWLASRADEP